MASDDITNETAPAQEAKFRTAMNDEVPKGEARLPRELFRRLGVTEGERLSIEYEGRKTQVRAVFGALPWAECNPEDIRAVGASSGAELRFKRAWS